MDEHVDRQKTEDFKLEQWRNLWEAWSVLLVGRPGGNSTMAVMWQPEGSRRAVDSFRRQTQLGSRSPLDQLSCCFLFPNPNADINYLSSHPQTQTVFCCSQHPQWLTQCLMMSTQGWILLEQPLHQISCLQSAAAGRRMVRVLGHTDSLRSSWDTVKEEPRGIRQRMSPVYNEPWGQTLYQGLTNVFWFCSQVHMM